MVAWLSALAPATFHSLETLFLSLWYQFLLEAERDSGPSATGKIR
jgi:hypothetical protein